ncbi:MAG: hypothetical protein ACREXJ_10845, partial [Gammaproteobacteria bacterium]
IAIPGARCDAVDRSYGAAGQTQERTPAICCDIEGPWTPGKARGDLRRPLRVSDGQKEYFERFPVLEVSRSSTSRHGSKPCGAGVAQRAPISSSP